MRDKLLVEKAALDLMAAAAAVLLQSYRALLCRRLT
jgi:hypothetical protein